MTETKPASIEEPTPEDDQVKKNRIFSTEFLSDLRFDKSVMTAQAMLIAVNGLACLCGVILFIGGIAVSTRHAGMHDQWDTDFGYKTAAALSISLGVFIILVSGLGE